MAQIIAIVTMVIDHISNNQNDWLSMLGNISMPIYVYRQANKGTYKNSDTLLGLALIAEIPYTIVMKESVNIIWLFWIAATTKEWEESNIGYLKLLVVAIVLEWICITKVAWLIWLILLRDNRREVWYGVQAGMAILTGQWQWLIHVLGYECARSSRLNSRYLVPRWIWRYFYPGHLLVLAGVRGVCAL